MARKKAPEITFQDHKGVELANRCFQFAKIAHSKGHKTDIEEVIKGWI